MEATGYLSVDRIEDGIAVLIGSDGVPRSLPLSALPPGSREGDLLREEHGSLSIDAEATGKRKRELKERLEKLFKK